MYCLEDDYIFFHLVFLLVKNKFLIGQNYTEQNN